MTVLQFLKTVQVPNEQYGHPGIQQTSSYLAVYNLISRRCAILWQSQGYFKI